MSDVQAFINRWSSADASERSNSQPFLCELSDVLGVDRPHNTFDHGYAFEFPVTDHHPDGTTALNGCWAQVVQAPSFKLSA